MQKEIALTWRVHLLRMSRLHQRHLRTILILGENYLRQRRVHHATMGIKGYRCQRRQNTIYVHRSEHVCSVQLFYPSEHCFSISAAIREETMKAASRQSAKSLEGYQPHQEHHYPFGWSKGTSASPTRSISPKRQWGNAISFCERISPVQSSVKGRPQNELEARVARLERSGLFSSRRSTPQLM